MFINPKKEVQNKAIKLIATTNKVTTEQAKNLFFKLSTYNIV